MSFDQLARGSWGRYHFAQKAGRCSGDFFLATFYATYSALQVQRKETGKMPSDLCNSSKDETASEGDNEPPDITGEHAPDPLPQKLACAIRAPPDGVRNA